MNPGTPSSPPDHADVVIHPPLLYGSSFVLGVVAKAVFGGTLLPGSRLRVGVGVLFVLAGVAGDLLFLRSFRRIGQSPNPRTPTPRLISDGLYRYTRNPAYVGITVTQIGLALLLGNPWLLLVLVLVLPVMHYGVVLREEAYLERKFGDEYFAYKRRVRRWL
jgi:protein-S-isoprenylcysteine O-methyltransferase Ste14